MQTLLDTLIPYEDKLLVMAKAQEEAGRRHTTNILRPAALIAVPEIDPKWDPNEDGDTALLAGYRELILHGLKNSMPWVVTLAMAYEVFQGPQEDLTAYYHRLLDTFHKHTALNPLDPQNGQMVTGLFISHTTEDICKRLQKVEGTTGAPMPQLLEIAYRVFATRDAVKEKQKEEKHRSQLQAVSEVAREGGMGQRQKGRRGRGGWGVWNLQ